MSSENTTTGKVILRQDLGILMFLISVIEVASTFSGFRMIPLLR